MRFTIEAEPTGGLRVIKEIPDGEILRVEGQNGIGKTVAVRLLELCTGVQTFPPSAWATLRQHLRPTTVTVTGLKDGGDLVLRLDPEGWPTRPEVPGAWLGQAWLDGDLLPWSEVFRLISVRRVGGDETLGSALASQIRRDADALDALSARQSGRRTAWIRALRSLHQEIAPAVTTDLTRLSEEVAVAEAHHLTASSELRLAADRVAKLDEGLRLLDKASQLADVQPVLERDLARSAAEVEHLRQQVAGLDREAVARLERAQRSQEDLERVDGLVRTARNRRNRLERRRSELRGLSERCGVGVPVDLADVETTLGLLDRHVDELRRRRLAQDRAGLVLEVIDDVDRPLRRAMHDGLGDEVVAQRPRDQLTVEALATALERRREQLLTQPSSASASLAASMAEAEDRREAARALPRAVRLLATAESDLLSTEAELEDVLGRFGSGVADDYQAIDEARGTLLDRIEEVAEERSRLEARIADLSSEGSVDDLRKTARGLDALLTSGDEATFRVELETLRATVTRLQAVAAQTLHARDTAEVKLADGVAKVTEAVQWVAAAPALGWLEPVVAEMPLDGPPSRQRERLQRLDAAASARYDLLIETLNDIQSVTVAMRSLAQRLVESGGAGNLDSPDDRPAEPQVRGYYEEVFARQLAAPELSTALFDGGREIAVDLVTMSATWTSSGGLASTRPLEAFSSGQRAFAYTRVRLESLTSESAQNRVVVLDEFGAFIARDRVGQLDNYLRSKVIGDIADQVVLILPLTHEADQAELAERGGYVVETVL